MSDPVTRLNAALVVVGQHQVPHLLRHHRNSNPINNRRSSRQHPSGSPIYQVG